MRQTCAEWFPNISCSLGSMHFKLARGDDGISVETVGIVVIIDIGKAHQRAERLLEPQRKGFAQAASGVGKGWSYSIHRRVVFCIYKRAILFGNTYSIRRTAMRFIGVTPRTDPAVAAFQLVQDICKWCGRPRSTPHEGLRPLQQLGTAAADAQAGRP